MSTEVAKIGGMEFLALTFEPTELRQLVEDNIGGGSVNPQSFDRVRVPAGGARTWEVPNLDAAGGVESAREINCIILFWHDTRTYWQEAYTGEQRQPDCSSPDGVTGYGDPGGSCDMCAFSQWGSDPGGGRGQACKAQRLMYVLRPNELMPMAIQLPPTSIQPMKNFFLRLASRGIRYHEMMITLSLEQIEKPPTPKYSRVVFTAKERLNAAQFAVVSQMREALVPHLQARRPEIVDETANSDLDRPL